LRFQKIEGVWTATNPIELSENDLEKLSNLIDAFDENEDVQGVYTNVSNLD
jgi:transcriptional/translational regulatory protein YebC/TACO1